MIDKNNFWTTQRNDGKWAVKKEGSARTTSIHDNQDNAWKEARRLARGANSEAFLTGNNGEIRAHNSYGLDNFSKKD
ncbi:MAG: DUF2188 domain-containing protein [Melioribacteraceae bacterium]